MPEHIRFLSMSERFLNAAKALSRPEHPFPVPHYLAGHALELALKAHLLHRGADEKTLRKVSHDLEAALGEADQAVRDALKPEQLAAIKWLNAFYSGKVLEYPEIGKAGRMITIPEIRPLLAAAENLSDYLRSSW